MLIKNRIPVCFALVLSISTVLSVVDVIASEKRPASDLIPSIAALVKVITEKHPEIQSANAALQAASARLSGAKLPLYNPEIEVDSERLKENGDPVYTTKVGISQTIDWHGKSSSNTRVAEEEVRLYAEKLEEKRFRIIGEIMNVLIRYKGIQQVSLLNQKRVDLLRRFLNLSEQRRAAGDVGEAEVFLAKVALDKAIMEQAPKNAELVGLEGKLQRLGGIVPINLPDFPGHLPLLKIDEGDLTALANNHPEVRAAILNNGLFSSRVTAADSNRKVDPKIGLTVGRQDNKDNNGTIVSLNVSIPIPIRNDFSSSVMVAQQEKIQAENDANNTLQQVIGEIDGARKRYQSLYDAWRHWQERGRTNLDKQLELLERFWKTGEIPSSDYLVQLQQIIDTQISGQETHGQVWASWVEWLIASGRVEEWLLSKNEER
ncbi:MAG: TolC family protein [Magnetococcales bacterium]|nr:TolC family protein [Magnetococcales bacterium]MBF0116960.1 TolC family protein [Magnetococcales bacterium]